MVYMVDRRGLSKLEMECELRGSWRVDGDDEPPVHFGDAPKLQLFCSVITVRRAGYI